MGEPRNIRRRSGSDLLRGRSARVGVATLVLVVLLGSVAVAATATMSSLVTAKRTVAGKSETIVVDGRGVTVYELGGESLARLQCLNTTCFKSWPPMKAASATAKPRLGSGVPGPVGIMRRVKGGFYQVMLDRHPLYYFTGDGDHPGSTKGQGIKSFGGTWHVVQAG